MPVTMLQLTSGGDATDLATYSTASSTPSANKLILLAVSCTRAGSLNPPTPYVSGNGLMTLL